LTFAISTLTRLLLSGVIGMVAASGTQALFHTALMRRESNHYQKQLAILIIVFMTENVLPSFIFL
jgi:hypothetical protein